MCPRSLTAVVVVEVVVVVDRSLLLHLLVKMRCSCGLRGGCQSLTWALAVEKELASGSPPRSMFKLVFYHLFRNLWFS